MIIPLYLALSCRPTPLAAPLMQSLGPMQPDRVAVCINTATRSKSTKSFVATASVEFTPEPNSSKAASIEYGFVNVVLPPMPDVNLRWLDIVFLMDDGSVLVHHKVRDEPGTALPDGSAAYVVPAPRPRPFMLMVYSNGVACKFSVDELGMSMVIPHQPRVSMEAVYE